MENDNEALEKHNGIWRAVEAKRSPISKCQFNSNRKGMARSSVHYNFKWLNFSKYHYEVLIYKCQKAKSIYIHGERERPKQNEKKTRKNKETRIICSVIFVWVSVTTINGCVYEQVFYDFFFLCTCRELPHNNLTKKHLKHRALRNVWTNWSGRKWTYFAHDFTHIKFQTISLDIVGRQATTTFIIWAKWSLIYVWVSSSTINRDSKRPRIAFVSRSNRVDWCNETWPSVCNYAQIRTHQGMTHVILTYKTHSNSIYGSLFGSWANLRLGGLEQLCKSKSIRYSSQTVSNVHKDTVQVFQCGGGSSVDRSSWSAAAETIQNKPHTQHISHRSVQAWVWLSWTQFTIHWALFPPTRWLDVLIPLIATTISLDRILFSTIQSCSEIFMNRCLFVVIRLKLSLWIMGHQSTWKQNQSSIKLYVKSRWSFQFEER